MRRVIIDVEASDLLNEASIDYTASPYKLKDDYSVWCLVERDIDKPEIVNIFLGREGVADWVENYLPSATTLVAHNGIDFDFLVIKLLLKEKFNYILPAVTGQTGTINGKAVEIVDTLVVSKCLNPDRYGGHSLGEWGKRLGEPKSDWRAEAISLGLIDHFSPKGAEFKKFHSRMVDYCAQDTAVNVKLYWALVEEIGSWDWADALCLEHYQRDITTRQSHRGFAFDKELAESNIRFLDQKMEEIKQLVEPLLPPKPMGKTAIKAYLPPKIQFKKNGELSAVMLKWLEKHGSTTPTKAPDGSYVVIGDKCWKLPMDCEIPIKTHEPASVSDTTHIKGYLVSLGWKPSQYKERDLTVDVKKQKLSKEKFEEVVERYVEQTLASPFCADRCAELDVHENSLRTLLLRHKLERPLKVYTNPTITVGMEKEIDPALLELAGQFPHAKLVSEYLTYSHRRNSILGGGVDPDEVEEDDEFAGKGFLAAGRIGVDGRIPTPADSCGAGTARFKHKLVANIPRVTSLFGKEMRGMFGVDVGDGFIQLGYDFDSLEANIEAHYVYKYPGGPEYGVSLTAEKPNDCHCFDQDTEVLTEGGWKQFGSLADGEKVAEYDPITKEARFVCPLDVIWKDYTGPMVKVESNKASMLMTPNHRVLYTTFRDSTPRVVEASKVFDTTYVARIPTHFVVKGGAEESTDFLNVLVAAQADGHFAKDCQAIVFSFTKQRKINSLLKSLDALGEAYSLGTHNRKGRDETTIRLPSGRLTRRLREQLTHNKKLPWSLLNLSEDSRRFVVDVVGLWDGTVKPSGDTVLDTRCAHTAEVTQALAHSVGLRAKVSSYYKTTEFGEGVMYRCYISRSHKTLNMLRKNTSEVQYSGKVGCVSVPSGFVVVRREGVVFISGNSVLARKISELLGRLFPRQPAKNVKYGCSYNAQAARVAKTVGCTLAEGQIIFDAFWEYAAPLKALKEKMQEYWATTGQKKFLRGIDGRKLPIRSKGNVINTAFQSAGVICAKRAQVLHEQKLKHEGLFVDFFLDDWKAKNFCQQLIAYHDESQLEIRRSTVTWKKFGSEESCRAFKTVHGEVWSDPVHNHKGWFKGYCRAGEMATEAVRESGEYYKLNVPLSAGYMLGRNWAECH